MGRKALVVGLGISGIASALALREAAIGQLETDRLIISTPSTVWSGRAA